MKKEKRESITGIICYAVFVVFFLFLAVKFSYGLYGDSQQYIDMHMHREPVYPLFLCFFRALFGSDVYLTVVVWAQNIMNAFATIYLFRYFEKRFQLSVIHSLLSAILFLMPHIMTPIFSVTHVILSNAILSEAITFPLFMLFLGNLISFGIDGKRQASITAFLIGIILSMTRGSMMICIIAWMIVSIGRAIYEKKRLVYVFLPFLFSALAFVSRAELSKAYNYVVNDIAIYNMCGNMDIVTNIFYASNRDAGELIENPVTRELFYQMYDGAKAEGLVHSAARGSWYEKTSYLENAHDKLKFEHILKRAEEYYYSNIGNDYVEKNKFQDSVCKEIMNSIWKSCVGRWIVQYIGLILFGAARSVAIVLPFTVIPTALFLLFSLALCLYSFIKKKHVKEALALLIVLMMLVANICGTAIVIMCLSRYMIYCFSAFYISLSILVLEYIRDWKKRKKNEL